MRWRGLPTYRHTTRSNGGCCSHPVHIRSEMLIQHFKFHQLIRHSSKRHGNLTAALVARSGCCTSVGYIRSHRLIRNLDWRLTFCAPGFFSESAISIISFNIRKTVEFVSSSLWDLDLPLFYPVTS